MQARLSLITFVCAVLCYGASSAAYYIEIIRTGRQSSTSDKRREPKHGSPLPPLILAAGAACHLGYVAIVSLITHTCPMYSVHFFLSLSSLLATLVYLIARRRFRIHALGLVVAPFGLMMALSTFFLGTTGNHARLSPGFITFHVLMNLIGAALFLLASGAAVMYLVQHHRLKSKKAMLRNSLPPLAVLEKALYLFLVAAFPLLTVGVATGTIAQAEYPLDAGHSVELLRTLFGYAAWLLVGAVLLLRILAGWRGRRAAYGTVVGFACAAAVLIIYVIRSAVESSSGAVGGG